MSDVASSTSASSLPREPRPMLRVCYLGLGWIFVGLGLLGAVLPLLPTTPFLLLAVWAFARSSRRLHDWLYHHPRFGQSLRSWRDHRVISWRAKTASLSMMSLSMVYVAALTPSPVWAKMLTALCLCCVGAWIATRPSVTPGPSPSSASAPETP